MRLRNVPGSREAIADSPLAINEPKKLKGKWNEEFGNNNPIRIEIGMGKGKFITQLAMENPDINYVGIEKTQQTLKSKSEVSELSPYEEIDTDKTHGSIYIGKSTTDTENPIPKENTTGADELGSMVWKIGEMKAGEIRISSVRMR